MKRIIVTSLTAFSVSAQNTFTSTSIKRFMIRQRTLYFISVLSMHLFSMSTSVKAQETQRSKYQSFPTAMRQKLEFQDTVKSKMALIKARYQKQIDSLIVKEMDGKEKWAKINQLTQERNYKMLQVSDLVKAKMRVSITQKPKEQ